MLEELKEIKQQQASTQSLLIDLNNLAGDQEAASSDPKNAVNTFYAKAITEAMNAGFDQIKSIVEARPKSITKQWRIVLFPEGDAREYYKVVGKIFLCLLAFSVSTFLFVIGKDVFDAYPKTKYSESEVSNYRKAWTFFYNHSKRSVRQKMDSAWSKATKLPD